MDPKLADFFNKKQKQSASTDIDWDDRRNRYLKAVKDLYSQIETMLAELVNQKKVMLLKRPKSLTETYIGTYSADDLILVSGAEQVRFSPRGRNIVGAAGRIDVIGERGEATLILQPDSRWGYVKTRQPTLRVVPFDEVVLAEVLQLVMKV